MQVVGTTCPEGYECFPIDYGEPCGQGQCRPCSYGMYCPAGTANPYSTYQHNACPAGKNCPAAVVDAGNATSVTNPQRAGATAEDCAEGNFCVSETYDGGVSCPDETGGSAGLHAWGYKLYCATASVEPTMCAAGKICANSTTEEECPAGSYCDDRARSL